MVAISSAVLKWARTHPDKAALCYGGDTVTYAGLAARVQETAGMLVEQGIGKGDVVALLMKNSAAFIELMLALSHIGAVSLPINFRLSPEEVNYILGHAEARLLCVDHDLQHPDIACRMVAVSQDALGDSRRILPSGTRIEDPVTLDAEDTFRLMYTSGTTDHPKGVVHTYSNYYWKCLDHITTLELSTRTRLLITGPLYHVGAFDLPGLAVFLAGGTITVLRDFDPRAVLAAIQEHRITGLWLAPIMLNRLLAFSDSHQYDRSTVQWVIGGGERTPVERIQAFRTLFTEGRYIDAYGLTETCSGDTMMVAGREIEKIGSAGMAMPHVRIAICDEKGSVLPSGEIGEICLSGPKVTRMYWRDPERTEASFFGDLFRTGDMGYLDDDGFLFLVDRKKDMVLSGGENIASSEVERILYQIEGVQEAAVIGVPDPVWGERVVAVLALSPGFMLTLEELQKFCSGKIASFKIPKQLVIKPSLPRNPSGKILKRTLRDELESAPVNG